MIEEKTLKTLEFNKILEELKGYTQSEGGKNLALALKPETDYRMANALLSQTEEADRVLFEYSISPNFAIDDISGIIEFASKSGLLTIADVLKVGRCLRISRGIKQSMQKALNAPCLKGMAESLFSDKELEEKIYASFLSETEVADDASVELKNIRNRILKTNGQIKTSLQKYVSSSAYTKYLQDSLVTIRNDRYVIPVKSEFKGVIPGLIHDQSASGATLYIEPMAIVEMNNQLKTLLMEEEVEIEKILRRFSTDIGGIAGGLKATTVTIEEMDLIFAKAQYAKKRKCICPKLTNDGIIKIVKGRHPLIDPEKVVPVSIELTNKILLITGPNTGGKTVTLKLVGVLSVMAMCGMFIPCSDASISAFDGIYCDIGDEQSIEQNLSTFSSHIKNIIDVLGKVDDKSLCLFDELGAGTDPIEGAALAVAISERIISVNAKAIITSHFGELKEFALTNPNIETASMDFDSVTYAPTYKLIMGSVGTSNALKICERLGLDKSIIDGALKRISSEKIQFDNVLLSAENTRRKAEQIVSEAEEDRQKAAEYLKQIEDEKKTILLKREKLEENIRKGTKNLINDSVEEANDLIAQIKEILAQDEIGSGDLIKAQKLRKSLEYMSADYDKETAVTEPCDDSPLKVGDTVYVTSLSKSGVLSSLSPKGDGEVKFGKLSVRVKKGDFYKVKK